VGLRKVDGERKRVPVLDRAELKPGMHWSGPSLIEEATTTTWIPRGWEARVTRGGHMLLSRE
jgi:N-methylhydantoinase A/oxoprolinase/acetone carboxylase beta subunit